MEKMNENNLQKNPLVSICVISYNSSAFVLETLESAKKQTYQNIELIVSDDGSTDHTIELCKNWLAQNKERFVRTEMITVEKNTGIPANCNRAVKAAKGEWIKIIAADDILMDNCIIDNVENVVLNPEIEVQFSFLEAFGLVTKEEESSHNYKKIMEFFNMDVVSQFKEFLTGNMYGSAPSLFIKKQVIENLNYYDENLRVHEDYPFWVKCLENGYKFYFLDKKLYCTGFMKIQYIVL